jgi:hypothetical protein
MTVPDGLMITAIVGGVGFISWGGKLIASAYVRNMDKQCDAQIKSIELRDDLLKDNIVTTTRSVQTLIEEHRTHDKLSAEAHGETSRLLGQMTTTLIKLNGKTGGK